MTRKDQLWALYLHSLSGLLSDPEMDECSNKEVAVTAITVAREALRVWEENKGKKS